MVRRPVQLLVGALVAGGLGALLVYPSGHQAQATSTTVPIAAPPTDHRAAAAMSSQAALRVIVSYKHGIGAAAASKIETDLGLHFVKGLPDLRIRVVEAGSIDQAKQARAGLQGRAEVAYAEPDVILALQDNVPNDPSFPTPNSAIGGGAWGWTMTHTTRAWDITTGSSSVVIAILDTGLKPNGLADFDGQVASTWNVLNNTTDVTTNAGTHGTYVAGIAGFVRVGTDGGIYLSAAAAGLTWAADHGARIANMSFGAPSDSITLQNAISYAHGKGMVIAAAAGNANCDCPTYPAADPGVIGVAGVSNSGSKAGDSNFGSWVALAAPEGNMTAWPSINGAPGYAPIGGTSSASPVVAGIAGLLLSKNPSLTNTQVEQALESSAQPVNFSVQHGRVDALAAFSSLGFSDPQPASAPVNTVRPQLLVETNGDWNYQPLTAAPQVGQVLLRDQGAWTGSAPLIVASVSWERCDASGANCALASTAPRYAIQATDAGSAFYFVVTVTNAVGSTTIASGLSSSVGATSSSSPSPSPSPSPYPSPSPGPATTTQTLAFSGSLNAGNPIRSFTVTVGSGSAHAQLSFTKCSSLSLTLTNSSGTTLATATGPSVVVLDATLPSGNYVYIVTGGKCSFTLDVTAQK